MENKKKTAVLPIKAASIKLFSSIEEIYESAKKSPPFIRKIEISSLRKDIAEQSASRFIFGVIILSVSLAWIGEFSKIESIWFAGFYLGIFLILAVLAGLGLSIANINMSKYYISLFARFPGNRKTKYYISELEKLES